METGTTGTCGIAKMNLSKRIVSCWKQSWGFQKTGQQGNPVSKINRDPTGLPPVSEELIQQAKAENYQIVYVVCDQAVDDESCVSFMAMTPFLPRPGDQLQLEDGQYCSVIRVYFKVGRLGDHFALVPTVYATLLPSDD